MFYYHLLVSRLLQKMIFWPKVYVYIQLLKINVAEKNWSGHRAFRTTVHTDSSLKLFVVVCTYLTSAFTNNVCRGKRSAFTFFELALCIVILYKQMLGKCRPVTKYRSQTLGPIPLNFVIHNHQPLRRYTTISCSVEELSLNKPSNEDTPEKRIFHDFFTSNCNRCKPNRQLVILYSEACFSGLVILKIRHVSPCCLFVAML
jgi:hypothetical protein